MDPAKGAIDSLLPKLEELLSAGKLRKSARKQLLFLQDELKGIQHAFAEVEDVRPDMLSDQINKEQIKEWLRQARPLSYGIEHVIDKFEARRLRAANLLEAERHKLIGRIRFLGRRLRASRLFANDVQSYRDRIRELHIQLLIRLHPAKGAIGSLLPELKNLLSSGKLGNSAKKQVFFLQEKLTRIQRDSGEVKDMEWVMQARALNYSIEYVVNKFQEHADRTAAYCHRQWHRLTRNIRSQLATRKASRQFAAHMQSYRGRIIELDIQLSILTGPARGAIDSLLPKLDELRITSKLRLGNKARKQVAFLQEKLTGMHLALGNRKLGDAEWDRQARALSYRIEHIVDDLLLSITTSRKFAKDIQSYSDRILELDVQIVHTLLPELEKLLTTGKLHKKARTQVIFLQEKLPGTQLALDKVGGVPADQLSKQIKDWSKEARSLVYLIQQVVHKFLARRLRAADLQAAYRHKLISRIECKLALADASRQFAKDIQNYRDRIMEMEKQLISYVAPAIWSIDSLLPKLDDLLNTSKLQKNARKEAIFLQEKLSRIQHALVKVEDVPGDQPSTQNNEWLRRARALSYDIEHIVDKFLAHRLRAADHHKLICRIRYKMAIAEASRKFANDIQSYRKLIVEFDIAPSSTSPTHADLSNTAAPIPSPRHDIAPSGLTTAHADFSNAAAPIPSPRHDVAPSGLTTTHADFSNAAAPTPSPRHDIAPITRIRHDIAVAANDHDSRVEELVDHEVLVNKIKADERQVKGITSNRQPIITSILGSADLAKTTLLVNKAYEKLNSHFDCTAWVTVSQEPDIKNVMWNILCQISLQDDATFVSLSVKETIGEIKKALNNKRYFIVVEDLWDITAREIIKCALIENSKGSAILMTSHKVSVIRFPGVKIYRVGPLSENSSRELSGARDNCALNLVGIPERIFEDCSGPQSAISNGANLPAGETKEDQPTMPAGDARMTSQQLGEDNPSEPMEEKTIEEGMIDADGKAQCHHVNGMGRESIVTMSEEESLVTIPNKQEGQPLSETVGRIAIQGKDVHLPQEQQSGARDNFPDLVDITEEISEECSGKTLAISNAANLPAGEGKEDRPIMLESSNSEGSCDAGIPSQQLGQGTLSGHVEKILIEEAKIDADGEAKEDRHTMTESTNSEDPNAMGSKTQHNIVPAYVKSCLLYLNMFRDGYEISEHRLVSGWIAEGYILEHEGEKRLKELKEDRKLIKAVKTDADGKALYCLTATGCELINSFSAEENSVTILKRGGGQPLPRSIGRLAIQDHHVDLAQEQVSIVRSLIVSDGASLSNDESGGALRSKRSSSANMMALLSRFENLRVLELGGCGSLQNDHLNGIKSLLLLRYLVIGDGITDIPKNIGSLVHLQTLDLRATRVEQLPESIFRNKKLKCLRVNGHTKIPCGIGKMKGLQELGYLNISKAGLLEELSGLTNLTILTIVIWAWDDGYKDALLRYLGSPSMGNMKSLSIYTCCSLHIFEDFQAAPRSLQKLEIRHSLFLSLPKWICSLQNLSSLSIEVYKLSNEIIETLGEMKNLLDLSLKSKQDFDGNFDNGFRELTHFSFASNAVGKIFGPGAMEKVEEVHLSFQVSHATEGFNFGLECLRYLKRARIEILCFNANLDTVSKANSAIEAAKAKDPKLDFYLLPDKIEGETQAEHDTTQQNQTTSPSTSASESMKFVPSSPAQFCDRCGSEFVSAQYQFCPGCGTRRLTVQKK